MSLYNIKPHPRLFASSQRTLGLAVIRRFHAEPDTGANGGDGFGSGDVFIAVAQL